MNDFVEKVVYINLEHRTDRREEVENELLKIFPSEKIVRFNAIKHEKGGIGCSMSHIGALELAITNKWKNVLIVEDDMQWRDYDKQLDLFLKLVKIQHDVIMLSGHEVNYDTKSYRLKNCCARTAYLVENHYYKTLLDNFKNGLFALNKEYINKFRGDRYWNQLQQRDRWYIVMPQICVQRCSFSDIEKKSVNYSGNLNYTNVKTNVLDRILKRR